MSIQIFILSQLTKGDTYPYKLKKQLSEPIPFDKLGNLTESKLYYHFESLSKQGLIEATELIKEENRPDKQVFRITEKGRLALPEKIYELLKKANRIADMVVGIMYLQHVDTGKVIDILTKKLNKLNDRKQSLRHIYEQIDIPRDTLDRARFMNDYFENMITQEKLWLESLILQLSK